MGAILAALGSMTTLLVGQFLAFGTVLLVSLTPLGRDFMGWLFGMVVDVGLQFLNNVSGDAFGGINLQGYVDALDGTTKAIIWQAGIPEAMSIMISAIMARTLLRMIPFGRLGN